MRVAHTPTASSAMRCQTPFKLLSIALLALCLPLGHATEPSRSINAGLPHPDPSPGQSLPPKGSTPGFKPPIGYVGEKVSCPPGWDVVGPNCQAEVVIPPTPTCLKGKYNAELGTCSIIDEKPAPLVCPRLCELVDKAFEEDGDLSSPFQMPSSGTRNPVCACRGVIPIPKICPLGYIISKNDAHTCEVNSRSAHPTSPNSPKHVPAICPENTRFVKDDGCLEMKELRPKSVCPKSYAFQTKLTNDYAFHGRSYLFCLKSFDYIPKLSCPEDFAARAFPDFGNLKPGDPVPSFDDQYGGTDVSAWEQQARDDARAAVETPAPNTRANPNDPLDATPDQIPNQQQFIDEVVQPGDSLLDDDLGGDELIPGVDSFDPAGSVRGINDDIVKPELQIVSLDPSGRSGPPPIGPDDGGVFNAFSGRPASPWFPSAAPEGPPSRLTQPQQQFSSAGAAALNAAGVTRKRAAKTTPRRLQAEATDDAAPAPALDPLDFSPPSCNLLISVPATYCNESGKCRGKYIFSLKKKLDDIADRLGLEVDDLLPGGF